MQYTSAKWNWDEQILNTYMIVLKGAQVNSYVANAAPSWKTSKPVHKINTDPREENNKNQILTNFKSWWLKKSRVLCSFTILRRILNGFKNKKGAALQQVLGMHTLTSPISEKYSIKPAKSTWPTTNKASRQILKWLLYKLS